MDLADIPAAAAFLRAEQPTASVAESARSAPPPSASSSACTASRLPDPPEHSSAMAMDPAAAAALLGAAHFYPAAAAAAASAADAGHAAAMAQHYYAQNLASFANVASSFMPMTGFMPSMGMFGGAPNSFLGSAGGAPSPFRSGPPPSFLSPMAGAPPPQPLYDMDATALQNQLAAQFTQATPEQQTMYYEGIRQQLDSAASGLNDSQKQALLRMDPSLSFSMKPIELEHVNDSSPPSTMTAVMPSEGGGGGLKRARTLSNATGGGTKKPRKNKASSCEPSPIDASGLLLLNEDTPDGSSSSATTPRATPRGRPKGSAAAGVQYTASGKKKSMTPQAEEMRARKAKMTWPKGTYLIRLQDVKVRNGRDHIWKCILSVEKFRIDNHFWLVDNHQLLQRYNNETGGVRADGSRIYHKTDRYTGWLCHEGWHYFPLFDGQHVLRQDGDTVTVLFPGEDDLQQAIDYQEQEKARRAEMRGADEPEARPLPPSIRDQPTRYAQMMLQQQQQEEQQQLEYQEQQRAHATSSGTSQMAMTSSQPYLMMKEEDDSMSMMASPSMMDDGMMQEMTSSTMMGGRGRVKKEPMGGGGGMVTRGAARRGQTVSLTSPSCSMTAVVGMVSGASSAVPPPMVYPVLDPPTSAPLYTAPFTRSRAVKMEMPSLIRQDHWTDMTPSSSSAAKHDSSEEEMHSLSSTMLLDEDILDDREEKKEEADESLADHTYTSRTQ